MRAGGSPSWKGRDYSLLPGGGLVSPGPSPRDGGSRGLHGRARASSKRLWPGPRPLGCPIALSPVGHQGGKEQRSQGAMRGHSLEGVCTADRGGHGILGPGAETREYGIEMGPWERTPGYRGDWMCRGGWTKEDRGVGWDRVVLQEPGSW